jgi:hypothetical protein
MRFFPPAGGRHKTPPATPISIVPFRANLLISNQMAWRGNTPRRERPVVFL